MGTKLSRSQQEWLEIISECRASGLSDRQWCNEHGIAKSTFYHHLSKLKAESNKIPKCAAQANDIPQVQEVVPLDILRSEPPAMQRTAGDPDPAPSILLDFSGFRLGICNHASADIIRNAIQALQQLC